MSKIIELTIIEGKDGQAPTVRADTFPTVGAESIGQTLQGNTDAALVARAMLSAAAYLFTQGQPVQFGAEVPKDLLK